MNKRIWAAAILVFAVLASVIPAAAEIDFDYEGDVHIGTGEPEEKGETYTDTVNIANGIVYDNASKMFIYPVGGVQIASNIMTGMVTTSAVSISVPEGLNVKLYLNGQLVSNPDLTSITAPGKYVLNTENDLLFSLRFTIAGNPTGLISEYQIPEGFYVNSIILNEEEIPVSVNNIDMTEEGNYRIKYVCPKIGNTYELNVTIDHTAPTLKLEALTDGYADGPVDISDVEKGSEINIYLNDEKIPYSSELTKSGVYRIDITDKAGNRTDYNFTIRVYFNFNSYAFIALFALLIVALAVYLILSRKHIRIR